MGLVWFATLANDGAAAPMLTGDANPVSLKLCADPDNMPYTAARGDVPGVYVEYAKILASKIPRKLEIYWWSNGQGKRAIRKSLLAGKCDFEIGLPAQMGTMGGRIAFTHPIVEGGYAFVSRNGANPQSLKDISKIQVAVTYNSPPQSELASRDDINVITFDDSDDLVRAVGNDDVAAGIAWEDTARYANAKQFSGRLQITPVTDAGMRWPLSIAVRATDKSLRDALDNAISSSTSEFAVIRARYDLLSGTALVPDPVEIRTVSVHRNAGADAPESIDRGRKLFGENCSHCHGEEAVTSDHRRDLRALKSKYGSEAANVFDKTIHGGRPAKGMPAWGGVLSEDEVKSIKAYIDGIQRA